MDDIEVFYLADIPQHGERAMEWIYDTWGASPGVTLDEAKKKAPNFANRDRLPIMFIAVKNNAPIGCVILRERDMTGWEHLTPWLASVYVRSEDRGKGVASKLVQFLEAEARKLGYSEIYLFTSDAVSLYTGLGWKVIEQPEYQGQRVTILSRRLDSTEPS